MKKSFVESKYFTVLLHILIWSTFFTLQVLAYQASFDHGKPKFERPNPDLIYYRFAFQGVIMIILYYLNSLVFIPRYLFNKKVGKFALALIATLVCVYTATVIFDNLLEVKRRFVFRNVPPVAFFLSIFILALSTSIKLAQNWFENETHNKAMIHEKTNSELSLLKSQVNPHFLFNTLNGIYSLAHAKSDKTAPAVVKLSQLMRYMLDESKQEFVLLSSELDYINTFIDLQRLRLFDNVKVEFNIEGNAGNKKIQPLLLIPFIENAFKHGTDSTTDCLINIDLKINNDSVELEVKNDLIKSRKEDGRSGFGLHNIQRRLELEYPERHVLTTEVLNDKFIVKLFISIK